jgi:hypothetical protein
VYQLCVMSVETSDTSVRIAYTTSAAKAGSVKMSCRAEVWLGLQQGGTAEEWLEVQKIGRVG